MKRTNHKIRAFLLLVNALVITLLINQLSGFYFFRIDLTEEGRYSIKPQTRELLENLDDEVVVEVYLEGELNAGFTRFQRAVRELLEEFSIRSGGKVTFLFTDPMQAEGENSRNEFMSMLVDKGLKPLNIIEDKGGKRSEKIVFPGAVVSYSGLEAPVNLLKNSSMQQGAQNALNQSIETLEYEFASAIFRLTSANAKKVAWIKGHGELDSLEVAGIQNAILEQFDLFKVDLPHVPHLDGYDLALVVRPLKEWSNDDIYKLDQFILSGGRVMFFIDNVLVDMNSISEKEDYGIPVNHGLQDLLFRYGVRINADLIRDLVALPIPVVTGEVGGRSQITPMPWPYYPLVSQYADHPATRNLDASVFRFVSSVDTVKASGVQKIPMVMTSPYTRISQMPSRISITDLKEKFKPEDHQGGQLPLVWMLEGKFQSLYKNRLPPEQFDAAAKKDVGRFTRLVVFGDADVIKSGFDQRTGDPLPAGFDPATRQTFANQDLVLNLMSYLIEDDGIINARNRKVTVRLLDKEKISAERSTLQWINLGLPVLIMVVAGFLLSWRRSVRFTKFQS